MSSFLYKIGRSAYDKPWRFLFSWVVILGIVGALIGVNGMHTGSEMKIEGTESQKVLDKLAAEVPAASGGQASIVFAAPKGERLDTPERVAAIRDAVQAVYKFDYVIDPAKLAAEAGAAAQSGQSDAAQGAQTDQTGKADVAQGAQTDQTGKADAAQGAQTDQTGSAAADQAEPAELPPYGPLMVDGAPVSGVTIANDGSVALFQFQFTVQQSALPKTAPDDIMNAVNASVKDAGGMTVLPSESLTTKTSIGSTEGIGLVVAAVVLLMTLGSVVAAGLPLLTSILGVAISVGGAFAFSKFFTMTDITPALALMVGLAVGIDYSLFIVNRQRRMMLDQGLSARDAASRAIGTAGSAVFFAGLTVIIALCGMLVIGIGFLSTMALVAAASVFVNVMIALTLLPALLGFVGERIVSAKARTKHIRQASAGKGNASPHGFANRWVTGVLKRRWIVIVGVVVVLAVAAIPAAKMDLGIPSGASANLDTTARQSYDAIAAGFGEGFNGPLILVAEPRNAADAVTPETLGGIAGALQKHADVSLVTPMGINKSGSMAIFSLIPKSGPTDKATKDLVQELRSSDSDIARTYGVNVGVTGFTAINIDMSSKLAEAFPIYVGVIVLLSIIILLLVFRSIIVPIKATVGFLLSVLATFGIATAVYQWGWLHDVFGFDTGGPLLSFMPIMVTGILYGLAMDYQVFLVSSMRESYVHGHRGNASVIGGYDQASRVVVAAAIIMVSVFAGFIFAPDIMIKQIGFALAAGILIDAFVVRMALVPAIMSVFGDKAWWLPRWLDRLLPNLDVEGDKLLAELKKQEEAQAKPLKRVAGAK